MANLFHNQVIHAMNHIDKLSLREGVNMVCFTELGMYLYKIMSFFGKGHHLFGVNEEHG